MMIITDGCTSQIGTAARPESVLFRKASQPLSKMLSPVMINDVITAMYAFEGDESSPSKAYSIK